MFEYVLGYPNKVTACTNGEDAPSLLEWLSRDWTKGIKRSFVSCPTTRITPTMSNTTRFSHSDLPNARLSDDGGSWLTSEVTAATRFI